MEIREVRSKEEVKRIKEAKRRRAKKRAVVFLCSFLFLCAFVFTILCFTVLFPITSVSVKGESRYSAEEIISASTIDVGDKLFAISDKKVKNSITVNLPYIRSVSLKRILFDRVELIVTPDTPTFCYKNGETYLVTDDKNKVLEICSECPENMTEIVLPETVDAKLGYSFEVDKTQSEQINLFYEKLTCENIKVNSVDISDGNFVTVKIEDRFTVNFGTKTDLEGKIEHLKGMLPQVYAKNGENVSGKIDLSSWSSTKREGYFEATVNF